MREEEGWGAAGDLEVEGAGLGEAPLAKAAAVEAHDDVVAVLRDAVVVHPADAAHPGEPLHDQHLRSARPVGGGIVPRGGHW